jgi:hypothetical protein
MSAKTSGRSVEKSTHLTTQVALSLGMIGKDGKLMPTPSASMVTAADMLQAQYAGSDPNRPTYAEAKHLSQQGQTGQLSPLFVEWLMGYPEGWTDLNVSETQ